MTGTLAAGHGGANRRFGGRREDRLLQLRWQLNILAVGNLARVHQREAENRLAIVELFRVQDRVAAEIAQTYAQAQQAARRVGGSGREDARQACCLLT